MPGDMVFARRPVPRAALAIAALAIAPLAIAPLVAGLASCSKRVPVSTPTPVESLAAAPAAARDTMIQADNDRMMEEVLAKVGDKASLPASQVFQNVSVMPNAPVRHFLIIMNQGYAKALGVRCTHCHVEGNFASDDKRPKRAAREMAAMHRMINDRLQAMENLDLPKANRFINCSTCHRGTINPLADPPRTSP